MDLTEFVKSWTPSAQREVYQILHELLDTPGPTDLELQAFQEWGPIQILKQMRHGRGISLLQAKRLLDEWQATGKLTGSHLPRVRLLKTLRNNGTVEVNTLFHVAGATPAEGRVALEALVSEGLVDVKTDEEGARMARLSAKGRG